MGHPPRPTTSYGRRPFRTGPPASRPSWRCLSSQSETGHLPSAQRRAHGRSGLFQQALFEQRPGQRPDTYARNRAPRRRRRPAQHPEHQADQAHRVGCGIQRAALRAGRVGCWPWVTRTVYGEGCIRAQLPRWRPGSPRQASGAPFRRQGRWWSYSRSPEPARASVASIGRRAEPVRLLNRPGRNLPRCLLLSRPGSAFPGGSRRTLPPAPARWRTRVQGPRARPGPPVLGRG